MDPKNPVWPLERHELGDIVPVASLPYRGGRSSKPPPGPVLIKDGRREEPRSTTKGPQRLSGVLPFMACYVSVVPGSGEIWMGEDRRDVLGAGKFPGQKRLNVVMGKGSGEVEGMRGLAGCGDPGMRFEHGVGAGGLLIDEEREGVAGVSVLRVLDGKGAKVGERRIEPRRLRDPSGKGKGKGTCREARRVPDGKVKGGGTFQVYRPSSEAGSCSGRRGAISVGGG